MIKALPAELDELVRFKNLVESEEFQKFIVNPLRERQDELKIKFFSESLKQAWRNGGEYEGIERFFKILKYNNQQLLDKQRELESQRG